MAWSLSAEDGGVRSGRRPDVTLDDLHREGLVDVLTAAGIDNALMSVWHELDPWPDVVDSVARLRQSVPFGPLSNAHTALLICFSRRSQIIWDSPPDLTSGVRTNPIPTPIGSRQASGTG